MRFTVSVILTAALAFAACLFLPWWSIAITSFIVALFIGLKPFRSFLAAFFGLFLLWGSMSFIISYNNDNILAEKVSMLIINQQGSFLLILFTAFTGGIVASLAGLSGAYLRGIISGSNS